MVLLVLVVMTGGDSAPKTLDLEFSLEHCTFTPEYQRVCLQRRRRQAK
jgi:hypothetical protein